LMPELSASRAPPPRTMVPILQGSNVRGADEWALPFAPRCRLPKVCCQTSRILSLAHGQLLEETRQSVADGLDRVGVVGVARRALFLEVGPLTHHASPFDVGIADEFLQAVVGVENPLAVAGQDKQRLIQVVEQELAPLDVTVQHDS